MITSSSLFLISFLVVTIMVIGALGYRLYRLQRKFTALFSDFIRLKRDMRGICAGTVGMGQRFADLEQRTHQWFSQQKSGPVGDSTDRASYAHASKIIEMGGSIEDIIKNCGLSRAEAELVAVISKQKAHS